MLDVLRQHAPVEDQSGLSASQRAANLAGSMRVRPAAREALARIGAPVSLLVCDDVLTTGATAREAQRALEEAGLRVRAVVTVAATRKRHEPGRPTSRAGSAPRAYPFQGHPSTVCTWRPTEPAISRELGQVGVLAGHDRGGPTAR